MSNLINKILLDLSKRKAEADSRLLPTPSIKREASATEKAQPYLPVNYGLLFCPHGKSYFDVCSSCKRGRKAAQAQYQAFCTRHGVE